MHVLVAVDRSEESWNALENALDIADAFDAEVTVVHAVAPEAFANGRSSLEPSGDGAADRGEAILEEALERATERGVTVDAELLDGDPVETISAYAERAGVDVIYVGHRGLTDESQELPNEESERPREAPGELGSVARGLVENTRIPVTIFDRKAE